MYNICTIIVYVVYVLFVLFILFILQNVCIDEYILLNPLFCIHNLGCLTTFLYINREKTTKTARRLTDLSTNVATALGKKLDVRDYKKLTKDQQTDLLLRLNNNNNSQKAANLLDQSRNLSNSYHTYSAQQHSRDTGNESDIVNEFNSLLNTMKNNEGGVYSSDGEEVQQGSGGVYTPTASGKSRNSGRTPYRQTPGVHTTTKGIQDCTTTVYNLYILYV